MMNKIRLLIISSSKEKIKILSEIISGAGNMELEGVCDSDGFDAARGLSPDIVLYLPESESDAAAVVEKVYLGLPRSLLILICGGTDMGSVKQAVRAGARNVLNWPVGQRELTENINYLYNMEYKRLKGKTPSETEEHRPQVVTVFGTKGGIGKTTISVNLSAALARLGKKTAVIDLDLQFGDVGVFLDMEPQDGISGLVAENNFDPEKIKSYMQLHQSGVSVLCAPKSPEYAEAVSAEHVERIISGIRPYFDFIIIDTPPAFSDITLTALERSDLILFVLTLDVSTLRNAKISMGILESLQKTQKTRAIVNREVENIISIKDAEKIIKSQIFCRIPSDWKTATMSLNKGVPFVLDTPGAKISEAVNGLAKKIAARR